MRRVLLISRDREFIEAMHAASRGTDWRVVTLPWFPACGDQAWPYDLVCLDCRTMPRLTLPYSFCNLMMVHHRAALRPQRVLIFAQHEELVGRMNSFVFGASAYFRTPAYGEPLSPIVRQLAARVSDTLALPPYRKIDFHDRFPNREIYRQLFESMQIPVLVMTTDGVIKLMNLRALARFDVVTHLVLDRPWTMLLAPDDRAHRADEILRRMVAGYYYQFSLRLTDRRGQEFPALINSSRVFGSETLGLLVVLTIQDISEIETLQRQLAAFQRSESVDRVVGGMAHEFNNMLTSILGHAELLSADLPAGSEFSTSADVIRREARRASELTGRLMGLSRSRQFVPGPVSLNQVVRETAAVLMHIFTGEMKLVMDLAPSGDMVQGEPDHLKQVLVNLCLNARDAMNGRGTMSIRTHLREVTPEDCRGHEDWTPGEFVEVAVIDTGCGMPDEVQDRILEPFFTTKPHGKGSGLGLSVVAGIVRAHGGHVQIISSPEEGTTIAVRLPHMAGAPKPAPGGADALPHDRTHRGELLLVDDDPSVVVYTQKVLERAGYSVCPATNGRTGIDIFAEHRDHIALVILDLTMPFIGGREVLAQIRQLDAQVPVILSTGYAEGGLDDQLVEQVQGFLKKPYKPEDVLEQVQEVLAGSERTIGDSPRQP